MALQIADYVINRGIPGAALLTQTTSRLRLRAIIIAAIFSTIYYCGGRRVQNTERLLILFKSLAVGAWSATHGPVFQERVLRGAISYFTDVYFDAQGLQGFDSVYELLLH